YLLTSSLFSIWLVCEYHYTRAECLRLNKFECLLLALTMKKPLPVSYYNGEDHETVFINEILLHERVNELNATKDQDVLTRLLFQSGQDILIFVSVELIHSLMQEDLIDEYRLMVFPIIVGNGIHQ